MPGVGPIGAVKHGFTFEDGTDGYYGACITGCGRGTDVGENNFRCTACSCEYVWGTGEGQLCSNTGPEYEEINTMTNCHVAATSMDR